MVAANVQNPPNSPDSCNLSGLFFVRGDSMSPMPELKVVKVATDELQEYKNNATC